MKFTHPTRIKATHRGSDRVKVTAMCLEAVKMNGNKPIKLFNRMKTNSEKNSILLPAALPSPKSVLISKNKVFLIFEKIKEFKVGVNQNRGGMMTKQISSLSQLEVR